MKKYILIGGIIYAFDGDEHYISPRRLCELYKLNPDECIFIQNQKDEFFLGARRAGRNSLKILKPRADGNYKIYAT